MIATLTKLLFCRRYFDNTWNVVNTWWIIQFDICIYIFRTQLRRQNITRVHHSQSCSITCEKKDNQAIFQNNTFTYPWCGTLLMRTWFCRLTWFCWLDKRNKLSNFPVVMCTPWLAVYLVSFPSKTNSNDAKLHQKVFKVSICFQSFRKYNCLCRYTSILLKVDFVLLWSSRSLYSIL